MKQLPFVPIVLILSFVFNACKNQPPTKPNIVFILVDDMGWKDLGYMGSAYYETPNIDRLAGQGMIFTQAYTNASNCAPTRASLLSGQYPPRHGIYTVSSSARGDSADRRLVPIENSEKLSLEKITLAEALKPAGYVSAAIGKWHVGHTPQEQGFDVGKDRNEMGYKGGHWGQNGEYLADRLTDEAVAFISQHKNQPFFLYLAHHAVHTPIQAKKDVTAKYEAKAPDGCHSHAEYAAMVESVDESVGKIHQTLENLGLSKNTLLIFISDNGGHGTYTCQKPLRGGKGMYYEGGIRVPMFAYWPETIRPDSKCEKPVITTDFYPTFLELAGATPPENYPLDGQSMVSILYGKSSPSRDAIYWHCPAYLEAYSGLKEDSRDTVFRTRPVSVIRKGEWKLLMFHEEWVLDGGKENIERNNSVELYDLKNDIGESHNLAQTQTAKRDELLNQLLDWQQVIKAPVPTQPN
ncbi:MAG: sulfatase [Bacteroidia bacterium]